MYAIISQIIEGATILMNSFQILAPIITQAYPKRHPERRTIIMLNLCLHLQSIPWTFHPKTRGDTLIRTEDVLGCYPQSSPSSIIRMILDSSTPRMTAGFSGLLTDILGWSRNHTGRKRAETLLARRRASRVEVCMSREGVEE